jgi:hypothetical protein
VPAGSARPVRLSGGRLMRVMFGGVTAFVVIGLVYIVVIGALHR